MPVDTVGGEGVGSQLNELGSLAIRRERDPIHSLSVNKSSTSSRFSGVDDGREDTQKTQKGEEPLGKWKDLSGRIVCSAVQ